MAKTSRASSLFLSLWSFICDFAPPWQCPVKGKSAGGSRWIRVPQQNKQNFNFFTLPQRSHNKYLRKESKNVTITNEKLKMGTEITNHSGVTEKKKKKTFIYYFGYKQSVKNLLSFKMFSDIFFFFLPFFLFVLRWQIIANK